MKALLVGPTPYNATDGVIIKGIEYLLDVCKVVSNKDITYRILANTEPQTSTDFYPDNQFDLIVVCGTPWLWHNFQDSAKYANLMACFATHPSAKRLFMGIGSCFPLESIGIMNTYSQINGMINLFKDSVIIVRDQYAHQALIASPRSCLHLLPCPAYFAYQHLPRAPKIPGKNILVWVDPTKTISATDWQDPDKLENYCDDFMRFYVQNSPKVYCTDPADMPLALRIGLPTPILLTSPEETLELMRGADKVLSGRVHCAVPARYQGADTEIMCIDTRSAVVLDYEIEYDFNKYIKDYESILLPLRKVGAESSRMYEHNIRSGFFDKYMSGKGLDIGFSGYEDGVLPILPSAIGIDIGYPGYDSKILPFPDESQDYVHSSHSLEHMNNYIMALKEWYRVLKVGGYMVIIVPHAYLYEKKRYLPSNFNSDHKRFYTPASLLVEIEGSLAPNTYRIRLLEDGDKGYTYDIPPNKHCGGQCEIILVIEKIAPPAWDLA